MPLFGVTIGLGALRDLVASNLGGNSGAAEAILWQKLRRGEIVAYCEWAYAAGSEGSVLITPKLSAESWIMAERVDWTAGTIDVRRAAKEIKYAASVFFWVSDLDFLEEKHSADEVSQRLPPKRRAPGAPPEKREAVKALMLLDLRNGQKLEDCKQEFITSQYGNHKSITSRFGEGATRNTCVKALREALSEFKAAQS